MAGAPYDPFVRGPLPVGVRSAVATDRERGGRSIPYEIWYPAGDRAFGLDLEPSTQDSFTLIASGPSLRQAAVRNAAPADGAYPLVVFSHTSYGHRRQSSFLCTHLASHGYVVAAPDHIGNTFAEWVARTPSADPPSADATTRLIERLIAPRVPDLRLVIDRLLGEPLEGVPAVVAGDVGLVGWSFGGWAVLATPEADQRIAAVIAITPGGSSNPLPGIIPARLTFSWSRKIGALLLAAEHDRFTPLDGIRDIYDRMPSPRRMLVLGRADHDHFGDHIEVPLVLPEHARMFARSLALAQLDATRRGPSDASRFLDRAVDELSARGVQILDGVADH